MKSARLTSILAAALLLASGNIIAVAQSDGGTHREKYSATYLINRWSDNWYIGVAGGAQTMISQYNDCVFTPEFEFNVTKWFTPSIGARIGYQGARMKEHVDNYAPYQISHSPLPFFGDDETEDMYGRPGTISPGLIYIHGDLMWNLITSFKGYKQGRRFDLGIYAHAGLMDLYDYRPGFGPLGERKDLEIALGPGMIGTLHITNRLIMTIDVRACSFSTRFQRLDGGRAWLTSASLGLAYDINGRAWRQIRQEEENKAEAMSAYAEAQRRLREIEEENRHLMSRYQDVEAQNKAILENPDYQKATVRATYNTLREKAEHAGLVLYYQINADQLNFSERRHLNAYIRMTLAENPDQVFYLTGSADKGTGSEEINTKLSHNRAENVYRILVGELGVKPENVQIRATIIADSHEDGELDRCVFIEEY